MKVVTFSSVKPLEQALKDAANAHYEFELMMGKPDPEWQKWYAEFIMQLNGQDVQS